MKSSIAKIAIPVAVGVVALSSFLFCSDKAVAILFKKDNFTQAFIKSLDMNHSALQLLEQEAAENPNRQTLGTLANYQLSHGDQEGWHTNMLAILDLPFNRTDYVATHQEIARVFIERGEWKKALPHVDPCTHNGDWWALQGSGWFHGVMGNTQKGLEYAEQDASRHKHDMLTNYILAFDAKPTEWSRELLNELYGIYIIGDPVSRSKAATVAYAKQDYEDAVNILIQTLEITNDPWYGIMAALFCEQQTWTERRDRILKRSIELYPQLSSPSNNRVGMRRFLDMYTQANTTGISDALEHKLEKYARSYTHEAFNIDAHAFAGELLRLKEHNNAAEEIFKEIVSINYHHRISEFIPYCGLRALGTDPAAYLRQQHQ